MPITEKQNKTIHWIEDVLHIQFAGKTSKEAAFWIEDHIEAARAATPGLKRAKKTRTVPKGAVIRWDWQKLSDIMRKKGYTAESLSLAIGQGKNYISARHTTFGDEIRSEAVYKIADQIGVSHKDFIQGEEPDEAVPVVAAPAPEQMKLDLDAPALQMADDRWMVALDEDVITFCDFMGIDPEEYVRKLVRRDISNLKARLRRDFAEVETL